MNLDAKIVITLILIFYIYYLISLNNNLNPFRYLDFYDFKGFGKDSPVVETIGFIFVNLLLVVWWNDYFFIFPFLLIIFIISSYHYAEKMLKFKFPRLYFVVYIFISISLLLWIYVFFYDFVLPHILLVIYWIIALIVFATVYEIQLDRVKFFLLSFLPTLFFLIIYFFRNL